jgi:hypothetical protein
MATAGLYCQLDCVAPILVDRPRVGTTLQRSLHSSELGELDRLQKQLISGKSAQSAESSRPAAVPFPLDEQPDGLSIPDRPLHSKY